MRTFTVSALNGVFPFGDLMAALRVVAAFHQYDPTARVALVSAVTR